MGKRKQYEGAVTRRFHQIGGILDNCGYCGRVTDWSLPRCVHCRWQLKKKVR